MLPCLLAYHIIVGRTNVFFLGYSLPGKEKSPGNRIKVLSPEDITG
jgi:hypothetical protein